MSVSYKKLWKLLIDRELKKKDLTNLAGISSATIAKMGRNENVNVEVLDKVCQALKCSIGDIVESSSDKEGSNESGHNPLSAAIAQQYGFRNELVESLMNLDLMPVLPAGSIAGVPGKLFIISPDERSEIKRMINELDDIPIKEIFEMDEKQKMFLSSLINNAEVVLKHSVTSEQ